MNRADARPRIHIWRHRDGSAAWSTGPFGPRHPSLSPGGCVDAAIERIGAAAMVVIVETAEGAGL